MGDAVDGVLEQWARQRPDLDVGPMGVVGRVSRVARAFERGLRANFARHDLEPASFDVLATLRRSGEPYALTPSAMLASAMVTSGAMTQRLDRLEQRGLVVRGSDPQDGRSVVVRLTDAGLSLVDDVLPTHLDTENDLLRALTPRERDQLAALLRKLLLELEGPAAQPAPDRRG